MEYFDFKVSKQDIEKVFKLLDVMQESSYRSYKFCSRLRVHLEHLFNSETSNID